MSQSLPYHPPLTVPLPSAINRRVAGSHSVSGTSPISKSQSWPLAINSAPRETAHPTTPQGTGAGAAAPALDDSAVEAQVREKSLMIRNERNEPAVASEWFYRTDVLWWQEILNKANLYAHYVCLAEQEFVNKMNE